MAEGSALEMVDQTVRFVHPKIQQSCGFVSVQKSEYFAVLPCCSVLSIFQNFRLNIWRVVRVVEGAALEMLCGVTATLGSNPSATATAARPQLGPGGFVMPGLGSGL